ncbi:transcriptional regulator [Acinetobacter gerneri]|uniref:Transcriptional regulator n=1 Tax=Acinetobacter gerneri TaxID=202952 RepID=A0AAW8JCZ9_9GAMM|nr:transcriptional regulator [Acinetobacter gerneri]MDQ9008139.1 transcriptional regulator [Acinetobacter gerneri]MDQ9012447.1 transcriptional regulator [Acinetobacter gerneri]MDQ9023678.1 transcriptional regulator [Acinetobacter gerneri]MDQ9054486.1 transcriptional regulator [Acinetobacter gerneri]MDQ9058781.1 transcriptional regulator [Acinetobacter gerneri]
MFSTHELLQKRNQIDQLRQNISPTGSHASMLKQSIESSWMRSNSAEIPKDRSAAPLFTKINKNQSSLETAIQQCSNELKHIAEQASMVVAVGDISSTILWSAASGEMQRAAERVNFIQGGQWREDLVGTNALALSLKTQNSSCVFSNEHYMESIHDWVCYAAPILDPYSKQILGVIDLSTTWNNHNSLGLLAAERCASIIQTALIEYHQQHLFIRAFSVPQVLFNGKILVLTPRQVEILTILSLCPQGMNLENLHQALYGERKVSIGTLKAEMSQLRDILGGMLGSRPYRLLAHVETDFLQAEQALDAGCIDAALKLCKGVFLAKTESPFLCAWRDFIESRLSEAIFKSNETDILFKHLARFPDAIDAVERLIELTPLHHPAHQMLIKYKDEH